MIAKVARGVRNNNPGNLERGNTVWQGMEREQTDPRFLQFRTPEMGIRALAKVLLTYYRKYQISTVRGLVYRWAPAHENDTEAYVGAVAHSLGVNPDDSLVVDDPGVLEGLVRAIIKHENGDQPYANAQLQTGVALALA